MSSVLFWSVISAAFIGPGTVTSAASAGARFGHSLLWALLFSTLACLLLQEASARITVASGRDLGQALRARYRGGLAGGAALFLVLGAIVLGCAAYEAGNILGGVAGAALGVGLPRWTLTVATGLAAASLLGAGAPRTVARLLGILVAVMGVAFLATASSLAPRAGSLVRGSLVPTVPEGAGMLVLALVGTTVVPYNLFLGSGLARGQRLPELRFGLAVAVTLGGVISMGILVVGASVEGPFGFETLSEVLERRLGEWARLLFAVGLFAAGLSSAVTAPLAAALTARSLLAESDDRRWGDRSWRFRAVWLGVLLVGVAFGLAETPPVPAILAAQALNGVLLPVVAVFVLVAVNDPALMGRERTNGPLANACLAVVVCATLVLGVRNLGSVVATVLGLAEPGGTSVLMWAAAVALGAAWPVVVAVRRRRRALSRRSGTR